VGARSALWRQVQADVYGQAVETVQAEEGAAYGAALLAGVGAGVWPDVDAACRSVVRIASHTSVDATAASLLAERYAAFTRLYPALRAVRGS
jgi:xylulokinase